MPRAVSRTLLEEASEPADRARHLNTLANRLSGQGDAASRAEALRCAREAADLYRDLANAQPAAYRPALAMALNNLANQLSAQGDAAARAEALRCAREAVDIVGVLSELQPIVFADRLRTAKNSLERIVLRADDGKEI